MHDAAKGLIGTGQEEPRNSQPAVGSSGPVVSSFGAEDDGNCRLSGWSTRALTSRNAKHRVTRWGSALLLGLSWSARGCNSACDTKSVASASCALDACQLSTEYSAFGQTFRAHVDVGSGHETDMLITDAGPVSAYWYTLDARGGLIRNVDGGCRTEAQADLSVQWTDRDATRLSDGSVQVDMPIIRPDPLTPPNLYVRQSQFPAGIEGTKMHFILSPDGRLEATISVRRIDQSGNSDTGAAEQEEIVLSGKTSVICEPGRNTVTFRVASGAPVEIPCREEPWPECNDVRVSCL